MDIRLAVNKFKAAKTDKERMFYLRTLEAVLKKELEKTRRVKEKLKSRIEYQEWKKRKRKQSVSV
jgi:predicted PP-loop superfamily ATPase